MSPLGPIYVDPRGQSSSAQSQLLSQSLLDRVEEAVNNIINTQLARACEVVTAEQESIAQLVELLLEHDTVEAAGIEQCFAAETTKQLSGASKFPPPPAPVPTSDNLGFADR
jgi:ATP-dependent Zn protease